MSNEVPKPGPCGNPDCEDGYIFEPPLQDGGLGSVTQCNTCSRNWQAYWEVNDGR